MICKLFRSSLWSKFSPGKKFYRQLNLGFEIVRGSQTNLNVFSWISCCLWNTSCLLTSGFEIYIFDTKITSQLARNLFISVSMACALNYVFLGLL